MSSRIEKEKRGNFWRGSVPTQICLTIKKEYIESNVKYSVCVEKSVFGDAGNYEIIFIDKKPVLIKVEQNVI